MIKTTANGIKSTMNVTEKIGSMIEGSYNIKDETIRKAINFSDVDSMPNKIGVAKIVGDK